LYLKRSNKQEPVINEGEICSCFMSLYPYYLPFIYSAIPKNLQQDYSESKLEKQINEFVEKNQIKEILFNYFIEETIETISTKLTTNSYKIFSEKYDKNYILNKIFFSQKYTFKDFIINQHKELELHGNILKILGATRLQSNVLAKFPLNVRKVFISEITQTLLQAHDPNLLSSKITHVKWLFEPNSRPAAIRNATGQQVEQEFWQIIFYHYSLLFQPHYQTTHHSNTSTPTTPGFPSNSKNNQIPTNCTHFQNHIELCKGVLIVLTMAGRTL
ncbi:7455_t:CDS:2, partial [Gigaspora margarita]